MEPQAASDKVNRAQAIIGSTLPLFDMAIELLEPQLPKGVR
jgi:hypothetical protein